MADIDRLEVMDAQMHQPQVRIKPSVPIGPPIFSTIKNISDQPPPRPAQGDVWQLVIADMTERRRVGIERYGVPLQPHNGRDPLIDAYQEALDLAVYLRQEIERRAGS